MAGLGLDEVATDASEEGGIPTPAWRASGEFLCVQVKNIEILRLMYRTGDRYRYRGP